MKSGVPLLGVVNQPFSPNGGTVHWGGKIDQETFLSRTISIPRQREKSRILIGSSEQPDLVAKLSEKFDIVKAGGAGHKLLMVALGFADAYINTGPSTYKWDTCGPHSILLAQQGGVVDCQQFKEIGYSVGDGTDRANGAGILCYRNKEYFNVIKDVMTNTQSDK